MEMLETYGAMPVSAHRGIKAQLKVSLGLGLALLASTALVTPVMAQAPAPSAPKAVAAGAKQGPEEIVVTARRRAESLQSVPVAVSVIAGTIALKDNRFDIQSLAAVIPTVEFRTSSSNKDRTVFMRGVGTISTGPGVEPSVSTVLDGVVLGRAGQSTVDILDLDHIEVLRGPQGTLFGKNASAGVVNIITKTPSHEFRAYVDGGYYGGGDERRIAGGVNGSIIKDKVAGLISVVSGEYSGNVRNLFNNSWTNSYDHKGGRGKLLFTPSDDLTFVLAADYMHSRDYVPNGVFVSTNRTAYPSGAVSTNPALLAQLNATGVNPSFRNKTVSTDTNSNIRDDNMGVSGQLDYNFNGYTLTSITAYRKWKNQQVQENDQISGLSAAFRRAYDIGKVDHHTVSEEARVASPKGGFVDYVVGAYVLSAISDEVYRRDLQRVISGATVLDYGVAPYGTDASNYSVFGEANINFTKSFRALLGIRLVRDEVSYYHSRVSTSPAADVPGIAQNFKASGSLSKDGYADRLGLQYDVTSDITAYATYSRGYKGPGYNVFFNMRVFDQIAIAPETSNSYEAGLKAKVLDNKLQFNLALFDMQFDNYQANFTDTVAGAFVTRLINAGKVESKGVEADFNAFVTDRLTLTGAIALTDAKVKRFTCPAGATASCFIDGKPLPFAPRTKLNVSADYLVYTTSRFDLNLNTDYSWRSKTQDQLTQTDDTIQPSYGIWNARLTLADKDQNWRLSVLAKNIANKHYYSFLGGGNLGGLTGWVPRDYDRYFGVNFHKDF